MKTSRLFASMRNVFFSFSYQIIYIFLNFFSRSIFIRYLGVEYLGINGLFGNILSVLSLADLGMSTAMIYSLYEPLQHNDTLRIRALISFYGKIYHFIALFVFLIGLAIIPFLHYLMVTEIPFESVYFYYILFLLNTVVSYLFIYKTVILYADQNLYIVKIYSSIFLCVQITLQIVALIFTKSFALYLLIQVFCTFFNNCFLVKSTKKIYPYLSKISGSIDKQEERKLFVNIKSLFLYRVGGVILNNTDNILISSMIGMIWVGLYSNYYMIVNAISQLATQIFSSLTASIGNLNISENMNKRLEIFYQINIISLFIFGISSFLFFCCCDDFIKLWIGAKYQLKTEILVVIILNYFFVGNLVPICLYRDTTGLFKKTRYVLIITSIINLVLSVFLGTHIGLVGILGATLISRLLTNVWYEPYVLFKNYFNISIRKYVFIYIRGIAVIIVSLVFYLIFDFCVTSFPMLICKAIIFSIVYIICFVIIFGNSYEFKGSVKRVLRIFIK